MKPEHRRLLHDALGEDAGGGRRDAILQAGGRILRRKRRVRFAARGLMGVAAVAALAFGLFRLPELIRPQGPAATNTLAAATPTAPATPTWSRSMSDEELLAIFPGTPVALAKVGDRQYLLFPRPGDEARFIDGLGSR